MDQNKIICPTIEENKELWTQEQDSRLQDLVEEFGIKDWGMITDKFNMEFTQKTKSIQQCYCRWEELLEESTKRAWTEDDELGMIIAHKKFKNRWADISEALKGRSNNTIKNKFYSVFRKIRGKIVKSDCTYTSKLELLEIHYITSLIEHYLAHPILVPKLKGKRGKDFIYSLIHNLNDKMVADYKKKVQNLTLSQGTMEELFTQLAAELKERQANVAKDTTSKPKLRNPLYVHRIRASRKPREFYELGEDNCSVQRDSAIDSSDFFDEPFVPPLPFSPGTLSAGPAAAAASAAKAPCFNRGFSEYSGVAKTYGGRSIDDEYFPTHYMGLNGSSNMI